ncbi:DUF3347 domain-containing protein [Zeaxanthinibacter enoshimensis]|uniref:Uncharacterized protein DUF3347 n=1 Tax=Zeaxanthinibacter enoshimensis TaxID=392009 RepID=A0A4V3D3T1_9FLAO|nr:DUF3347 domain-containing protein [Zeaxanthinibacter enoshimensis]TDQ31183.1 uncharacterized protein DUF3347 [Zeaxanthinibacter enoshimensis]
MKTVSRLALFLLIPLTVLSCKEEKDEKKVTVEESEIDTMGEMTTDMAETSFDTGLDGAVFHHYLEVKNALFEGDQDAVSVAAANMARGFDEQQPELENLAADISRAKDIDTQRQLFSEFTHELEPLIYDNLQNGQIYKQYCPMAFNNKGGYWLSDSKEIRNPYFGEKMANCGSIKETITPKS